MADIIKTFYNYGKMFEKDLLKSFNQISSKNIDTICYYDIETKSYDDREYSSRVHDDELVLFITSSAGGNLFPFIFMSEKLFDTQEKGKVKRGGLYKSFENMKKYVSKEEKEELDKIYKNLDIETLKEKVNHSLLQKDKKENYYLILTKNKKPFNQLYPDLFQNYIFSNAEANVAGNCFIDSSATKIGFDASLNFCSTNEMNSSMAKAIKPKLLPLSADAGQLVKLGFSKIFEDFKFKIIGLNYILLPTVFDESLVIKTYESISKTVKELDLKDSIEERVRLEKKLEFIVEKLHQKNLKNELLFSMLFYEKNNKEIVVSHTIEDIVPSRVKKVAELLDEFNIYLQNFSKYVKVAYKNKNKEAIYIRDYISDALFLTKLLFKKEKLFLEDFLKKISTKIIFGNNNDKEKLPFGETVGSPLIKDNTNFLKHQRLIDFLEKIGVLEKFNLIGGDEMEKFGSLKELVEYKFNNSDLLSEDEQLAREFYIHGMYCKMIIRKQYAVDDRSSLEKYLNSLGGVNMANIETVFGRANKSAGHFDVHGVDYDYLRSIFSETKSKIKKEERITKDRANIAFVMGNIDYHEFKELDNKEKKKEKNNGNNESK